ncbi:unnamed protein product, partial [Mesorhabditis belari]|uniref:Alpha-1,2-Mannosidase n=1 Tax=Mesorhabditis belari TaxID=2138241 RepID=A0AAF3FJA6_9BILA
MSTTESKPPKRTKLQKFLVDLSVGGVSAAISKTAVAPIERVKLLLQVQYSHGDILKTKQYKGIIDVLTRIPKEQGVLSFWRGNAINVLRYFPTQALNFAFNDFYRSVLLSGLDMEQDFWKYTALGLVAGGCAGATSMCFVYPLDVVRTRLTADIGRSVESRRYKGFVDCFSKTVKQDGGFTALYRGFFVSLQTYFIYRAVYFGLYDAIRNHVFSDRKNIHFVESFLIAQLVSICSSYLVYPWDTIRNRMMIKKDGEDFTRVLLQIYFVPLAEHWSWPYTTRFRSMWEKRLACQLLHFIDARCKMFCYLLILTICMHQISCRNPFLLKGQETRAAAFSEEEKAKARELAREMFYFGYDNYMAHAWPLDELDPIHCTGRGPDTEHPENININDVLGDYSLTLIDSLGSLVVFDDPEEFQNAVRTVINTVSFEKNSTVQVFEATIRVIGSLLSAHLIASTKSGSFSRFSVPDYEGEMLTMAHDLMTRLMPAFEGTKTGLPYPRVNLIRGVLPGTINETCTSGAGSLLLGNVIDIQTGKWQGHLSGLGAGLDSFYEYLLKAYILFDEPRDLQLFNEAYAIILENLRRGRVFCRGEGEPPLYVNVDARDGSTANTWIDALQASFAGVQVLAGDVEEAICHHAIYYAVWKKYGALPERFNWHLKAPDVSFYPLRPELAESTYHLYQATKNPFYLHVGREIMENINLRTRVECGFATVHDVFDGSLEDRMESFFLSETMKYLYLLFDENNIVNTHGERLLFTTEGHIFPIDERFRKPAHRSKLVISKKQEPIQRLAGPKTRTVMSNHHLVSPGAPLVGYTRPAGNISCESTSSISRHQPPLPLSLFAQLFETIGISQSIEYWFP